MYADNTISNYLNALASKAPAPGGGSAAAILGALGAALLSKVINFTVGKEKYKGVEKEMQEILTRSENLRENLTGLSAKDMEAYKKLSEAFKMPSSIARDKILEKALKEATAVPFEVCKKSHEGMALCPSVLKKGNKNLISDAKIAALFFRSAFRAAVLNVEINLKSIKDEKFVTEIEKTLKAMEEEMKG